MLARGYEGGPCKSAASGANHVMKAVAAASRLLFGLALLLWISAVPSHGQADAAANTTKVVVGARAALCPAQRRWPMERTEHRPVEGDCRRPEHSFRISRIRL